MAKDTDNEQCKDDDDRGNVLLQKSHAAESKKKRNETRNQRIQVVLKCCYNCRLKAQAACEL